VAILDDQVAGYARFDARPNGGFSLFVAPEAQRRGVGKLLLNEIESTARLAGVDTLEPWIREENEGGIRWMLANGFLPTKVDGPVCLYPAEADVSAYAECEVRLASEGIVIDTLQNLVEQDPAFSDSLFQFANELHERSSPTHQQIEEFNRKHRGTEVMRDAYFVARDGERLVGFSHLGPREPDTNVEEPGIIQQCFTGVLRSHRRRGIALALKLRTIAYCRQHGYRRLFTHSENPAMIALNRKLGFTSGPWLVFRKEL
jgi:GNAT superfamily N-acetyltransferase